MPAFDRYRSALTAISTRTGVPLPSLIVSFGVLHELTAVFPLVGIFYSARSLGVGETVVASVLRQEPAPNDSPLLRYTKDKCKAWVEEGEAWAERLGRRYGMFGYPKRVPGQPDPVRSHESSARSVIAGDVANAVVAYGATKVYIIILSVLKSSYST
jgi:hypothetical protein